MDEIEFEITLKHDSDEDLRHYVLAFEGTASVWVESESLDRRVGTIRGHRIDLISALHDGIGQQQLLECVTPEIAEFAHSVLGDERCLLPPSDGEALDAEECDGIVYIAELHVEPGFRGQGIGTELLRRLGATIDLEHCLIALKALPLREDPSRTSTPEEVRQVKTFYIRNGFDHANEEYMVKDARRCEAVKKRLAGRRAQR